MSIKTPAQFRSRDCEGEDPHPPRTTATTTQLTAMNFVDYTIEKEFASDRHKKLTIIACPIRKSFKYKVTKGEEIVYLGSCLEEAISEYNL